MLRGAAERRDECVVRNVRPADDRVAARRRPADRQHLDDLFIKDRGDPDRLREAQAVFDQTGGLHAAGLFTREGHLEGIAEDVGRHNAVDKVVGRLLMQERLPLSDRLLFVSGRTSFEIIQKAFLAGIPIVAAVSAPSSLAIELAAECGVTLIGFLRGQSFNIYSCPGRVVT